MKIARAAMTFESVFGCEFDESLQECFNDEIEH